MLQTIELIGFLWFCLKLLIIYFALALQRKSFSFSHFSLFIGNRKKLKEKFHLQQERISLTEKFRLSTSVIRPKKRNIFKGELLFFYLFPEITLSKGKAAQGFRSQWELGSTGLRGLISHLQCTDYFSFLREIPNT